MADPILVKLLAEAALQAAKDKESRNRLLAIILGPVIFFLLLVALTMYLATSPFSALSEWLVGDEAAAVDEFQKDYGYNNDSGIFERDFKDRSMTRIFCLAGKEKRRSFITISWTSVGQMNHTDRTRSAPMAAVLPA